MITARSVTLALCLVSAPVVAAVPAAQAPAPQQQVAMSKQDNKAAEHLNKYTKAALAASAASLVGGYALGNDVAMGIGLGGLGGVGTGLLQKNVHWLIAWIGESIVRELGLRKLCTKNPDDMEVTEQDLANVEARTRLILSFMPDGAKKDKVVADAIADPETAQAIRVTKAYSTILMSGKATSWITYLAFRYLEKKAEQTA